MLTAGAIEDALHVRHVVHGQVHHHEKAEQNYCSEQVMTSSLHDGNAGEESTVMECGWIRCLVRGTTRGYHTG